MIKQLQIKLRNVLRGITRKNNFPQTSKIKNGQVLGPDARFVLYTSLYNETVLSRAEELLYCLKSNTRHPLIETVVVLYDSARDDGNNRIFREISTYDKVKVLSINSRPKFSEIFAIAERDFPGRKIIIANSDIYFDRTLAKIDFTRFRDLVYVLSRLNNDGSNKNFQPIRNTQELPNFLSADAWIFASPMKSLAYAGYELGTMYSDSFLNTQLLKSLPAVINPCLDVHAFHLQQDLSESQAIDKAKRAKFDAIFEAERQRSGQNILSVGLHWGFLPDSETELKYNYKSLWSKKNIVFDVRKRNPAEFAVLASELNILAGLQKWSTWLFVNDQRSWAQHIFPIRGEYLNITDKVTLSRFFAPCSAHDLHSVIDSHANIFVDDDMIELFYSAWNDQIRQTKDIAGLQHSKGNVLKKIIIDVQFGLSNRLRALASAYLLAMKLNRELILVWQPDIHCDCEFDDLFVNHHLKVLNNNTFDTTIMDCYDYMNGPVRREGKLKINHHTDKDIYIRSAYTLDYKLYDKSAEDIFLRSLQPIEIVQKTVNEFDLSEKIGLHVRMGGGVNFDLDRWDSDEYLDATGKELMNYWREKSHFKTFLPLVEGIIEKNPSQEFFLAADMQMIYDVFRESFPDNTSYFPRNVYDRSKEQQITALIDLYCLSKTRMIYGSNWSSFTEVASRLGSRELKLSGVHFGKD